MPVKNDIATVPLAALESQASRYCRIIKWLIVSIIIISLAFVFTVWNFETETMTTETTTEVQQETGDGDVSGDYSSNNIFVGGDINGDTNN
jgi:regulatory protein YycH of two-component signal transduction system YycFG